MSVLLDHLLRGEPKWLALTPTQRCLLIELWMWVDEQQTDGHVPDYVIPALHIKPRDLKALTTPLAPGKGAWLDRNGDGWYAHDWHEMNPPTDPVERARWFAARRQRRRRNVTDESR